MVQDKMANWLQSEREKYAADWFLNHSEVQVGAEIGLLPMQGLELFQLNATPTRATAATAASATGGGGGGSATGVDASGSRI